MCVPVPDVSAFVESIARSPAQLKDAEIPYVIIGMLLTVSAMTIDADLPCQAIRSVARCLARHPSSWPRKPRPLSTPDWR